MRRYSRAEIEEMIDLYDRRHDRRSYQGKTKQSMQQGPQTVPEMLDVTTKGDEMVIHGGWIIAAILFVTLGIFAVFSSTDQTFVHLMINSNISAVESSYQHGKPNLDDVFLRNETDHIRLTTNRLADNFVSYTITDDHTHAEAIINEDLSDKTFQCVGSRRLMDLAGDRCKTQE